MADLNPCGLSNPTSTSCSLNASLQLLRSSGLAIQCPFEGSSEHTDCLPCSLRELFSTMDTTKVASVPSCVTSLFGDFVEEWDASEVLLTLLQRLEEQEREADLTLLLEHLDFQTASSIVMGGNTRVQECFEGEEKFHKGCTWCIGDADRMMFKRLVLPPFGQNVTLNQLIEQWFELQSIECDVCHETSLLGHSLTKPPNNLLVELCRFESSKRIDNIIQIPETLELVVEDGRYLQYSLVGAIQRLGDHMAGGHFTYISIMNERTVMSMSDDLVTQETHSKFNEVTTYVVLFKKQPTPVEFISNSALTNLPTEELVDIPEPCSFTKAGREATNKAPNIPDGLDSASEQRTSHLKVPEGRAHKRKSTTSESDLETSQVKEVIESISVKLGASKPAACQQHHRSCKRGSTTKPEELEFPPPPAKKLKHIEGC